MSQDSGDGPGLAGLLPRAVRERFAYKFFGSVLVVMVLTAGLGAVLFGTTTATLTDRTESQLESTAQLQAEGLDRWIEGLRHQTRLVSQAPPFVRDNRSDIDYHLLRQQQRYSEDILDVHYVHSHSREVLVSTNGSVEGTNLSRAGVPWARDRATTVGRVTNVAERVFVATEPYESPASGQRVLAFVSAPPKNTENLVVVEANLTACGRSFDQPDEAGYTTVHGGDGAPICGGASAGAAGGAPAPDAALAANDSGFATAGEEVLGHATVAGTGWTVLTHVPKSAAFGLRNDIATSMGALVVVPLIALGVVGVVIGRRAGSQLSTLTEKAAAMGDGDLDVDLESSRADEFGQLTRGFAEMRDALRAQIDETETAREEAEVARAEAVETNEYLRETAERYSEVLAACARGDLTQRMDPDGENDAMDRIAADFNEMVRELELTTGQLQTFAEEVGDGGEEVHASAETVKEASEQVAESIQRISDDAYEGKERLATVSQEMDAVAEELERIDAEREDLDFEEALVRVRTVSNLVDEAASGGETVVEESETVAGAAEEQAAELAEVSARALELKRTAKYLGDGISHFETEAEHEFVFQTGDGADADAAVSSDARDE
ncbi:methyl-accepting chemotaxis protein [Halosimplex pelagicum]|uniref:Methyl-accepting chemotaxis protein n=1 Tax=Halosimplex pelagicum TaxID=869886 RepID=A0A7D5T7W0_9EURY|nr:methyl-accepting chemotaxis protein [Halosimplex pelagicum]QLH80550.1 methyl-accepting chemotaxis protein [Halosimplex pelagicum]